MVNQGRNAGNSVEEVGNAGDGGHRAGVLRISLEMQIIGGEKTRNRGGNAGNNGGNAGIHAENTRNMGWKLLLLLELVTLLKFVV